MNLQAQLRAVENNVERSLGTLIRMMQRSPDMVEPGLSFFSATRHLERIADHATNIAEDIIYWVRGLDVRHGRALAVRPEQTPDTETHPASHGAKVTENSHALHPDVTPACDTQRA